jgi:hypothetical protein
MDLSSHVGVATLTKDSYAAPQMCRLACGEDGGTAIQDCEDRILVASSRYGLR